MNRTEEATGFLTFVEKMMEQSTAIKDGKTIAVYKTTMNHLKDFSKHRRTALEFGNFDLDFCLDFMNYLLIVKGFHTTLQKNTLQGLNCF